MIARIAQTQFGVLVSAGVALVALAITWAYWFGGQANYWGAQAVSQHNLSGVAALGFSSLNLYVLIGVIVFIAIGFFGGTR